MAKFAQVIVDLSIEKLDRPFTYEIPEQLQEKVTIGTQVEIPFGKGNRTLKGFVIGLSDESGLGPEILLKPISSVLPERGVTNDLIELAAFISKNFGGTLNAALKTVLPIKKNVQAKEIKSVELLVTGERAKALLTQYEKRHAVARYRVVEALLKDGELEMSIITNKLAVSSTVIKELEKQGIVAINSQRSFRNPVDYENGGNYRPVLTDEQQFIVDSITKEKQTSLIHGVTGSGKTEVYMGLIEAAIKENKQAILLIPEIALTYQTVMRFVHRFGDRVSVMHSKLSDGERYDQLVRAQKGEIDVMIGPRSALFTPFERLGLIIIDEEHEGSYKSETVPKYHAREVAIERARQVGGYVVLGSATPSLSTYYKCQNGEYRYYTLKNRFNQKALPKVSIVDLRQELRNGNRSMFSEKLTKEIEDRLEKKEQIMLFLNRRGVAGFVNCRSCGFVYKCPHCDVSLTEHRNGKLICHYCGYETQRINQCPSCGSKFIGGFKVGTQKVEDLVKQRFPQARVLRMDADSTKSKDSYEEILSGFANGEADILIGTQMIVKGHDFKNVTLVGILAADLSLQISNYMASERTFQLLTQAAGRAGRGEKEGSVVIQTYMPDHYSILTASEQNYEAFYKSEMVYRKLMHYPPVGNMLVLLLTSDKEEELEILGSDLVTQIKKYIDQAGYKKISLLGPTDATVKKIKDIYRKTIYIKAMDYQQLVQIKEWVEQYRQDTEFAHGNVSYDFNPLNGF